MMRRARHLVHDAETDVNLQLYQAEFLESPGKAAVGYSTGSGELPLKKIEYEGRVALVEGKLDAACARVTRGWGRVLERAVDADAPEAYKTPLACNMHGEGRRGGAWEGEGGGGGAAADLRESWVCDGKLGIGEKATLADVDHSRRGEGRVFVRYAGQAAGVERLGEGPGLKGQMGAGVAVNGVNKLGDADGGR